jgi:hypothetical protein
VALIDPFRVCIPYKNKEVIYKNKEGTCFCLCFGRDLTISYIFCFNFFISPYAETKKYTCMN